MATSSQVRGVAARPGVPTVHVNQMGYLTHGPKVATVATEGTAPLPGTLEREGRVVASGVTTPRGYDASAGTGAHTLDLSEVTEPGTGYPVTVTGDVSHHFAVGGDRYDSLRVDSLSFFYPSAPGSRSAPTSRGRRSSPRPWWPTSTTAGSGRPSGAFDGGNVAALARLQLAAVPSDLTDREQVWSEVVAAADATLARQTTQPFGSAYVPASGRDDWSSNGLLLNNLVVLGTAFNLTGEARFRAGVLTGLDHLLGRNVGAWGVNELTINWNSALA